MILVLEAKGLFVIVSHELTIGDVNNQRSIAFGQLDIVCINITIVPGLVHMELNVSVVEQIHRRILYSEENVEGGVKLNHLHLTMRFKILSIIGGVKFVSFMVNVLEYCLVHLSYDDTNQY